MLHSYDLESVEVSYEDTWAVVVEIIGGQSWDWSNVEDEFSGEAEDIIRDAVEAEGGSEEDAEEAVDTDLPAVLEVITEEYVASLKDMVETAMENLENAKTAIENI